MYQTTNTNIPIALYDTSDCFVDVSIVDVSIEPHNTTDIIDNDTNNNTNNDTVTPVSIKIIPQVVIPVHECEVIYYEPNTRSYRPRDDSINLYRLCTTIICTGIIFLSLSTILYNPMM